MNFWMQVFVILIFLGLLKKVLFPPLKAIYRVFRWFYLEFWATRKVKS